MILAIMKTEHFTFRALAANEKASDKLIREAWLKHHEQYRSNCPQISTVEELTEWYGISHYNIAVGQAMCDEDTLIGKG